MVAPQAAGLSPEKMAQVDRFMQEQVAGGKIAGGVVAVVHEGQLGLFQAYGQQELKPAKPMQIDSIFRIYSMSKAITTAAALRLYDEGKLDLEAPVAKYIPEFQNIQVATAEGLRAPPTPAYGA